MKIVPWSRCDVTLRSNKYIVLQSKKESTELLVLNG